MTWSCRRSALLLLGACVPLLVLVAGMAWLQWPIHPSVGRIATGLLVGGLLLAGMLWFSPGHFHDMATPAQTRRYYREFGPPMVAYVVVMLGWKRVIAAIDTAGLRVVVALLPAVLIALTIRALARYVRDADELQRRIELESVGLATALVTIGFVTAGFLQSAQLIAVDATTALRSVFPALCLCYGVARVATTRRYT